MNDDDGFHSISWDDTSPPPRSGFADMSGVGAEDDDDGFDKISPSPPSYDFASGSTSTATVRAGTAGGGASTGAGDTAHVLGDPENYEWDGKQMAVLVKDPVKEHEGSKDMYVSYAVQTKVSSDPRLRKVELPPHVLLGPTGPRPALLSIPRFQLPFPEWLDTSQSLRCTAHSRRIPRFDRTTTLHITLASSHPPHNVSSACRSVPELTLPERSPNSQVSDGDCPAPLPRLPVPP